MKSFYDKHCASPVHKKVVIEHCVHRRCLMQIDGGQCCMINQRPEHDNSSEHICDVISSYVEVRMLETGAETNKQLFVAGKETVALTQFETVQSTVSATESDATRKKIGGTTFYKD